MMKVALFEGKLASQSDRAGRFTGLPDQIFTAEREPPRSSETSTVKPHWTARIIAAPTETGGKRDRAAERFGVSRTTLWRKMKELGLDD